MVRAKPKCLVTTAIVAATVAAEALHHGAAAAVMPELRCGEEDQVRRPSLSLPLSFSSPSLPSLSQMILSCRRCLRAMTDCGVRGV